MKLNELMNELQYGESIEVECKKASNSLPKSVWETYSSFANTNGGTIYLGVDESKNNHFEIVGVNCPEKIIKDFISNFNNTKDTVDRYELVFNNKIKIMFFLFNIEYNICFICFFS